MIGSTRAIQAFAYGQAADMRKGFDGLFGLVKHALMRNPLSGDLYLFVNKPRTRAKVLYWDGTGLCVFAKRLERGRFARLWDCSGETAHLTMTELRLFLEGSTLIGKMRLSPEALAL